MTSAMIDTKSYRRWKRYDEMIPIWHNWLTELPIGWRKTRLSYLFSQMGSGTTPNTSDRQYYEDGTIPWVNTGDLNDSLITDVQKSVNELALRDHSALKLYPSGTLLVALYGATIGKVGILTTPSVVNQACFAMAQPKDIKPKFLLYWLIGNREHIVAMAYGGGQPNISGELIRSLRVGVPPIPEQRTIAAFLDRETARIDALIEQKERLIALLKEKRQAIITHAVTRGLNPDAEMKDSRVEWIGEIPSHWEVWRLKHACKLETGHTPRKSEEEYWVADECTIPWISLNDTKTLDSSDFIDDTVVKISPNGMQHSAAHLINAGAVVVNRDGARVGLSAITTKPMCVSQHIIAWVCKPHVSNYYLLHVLYAMEQEIYRITAGATIPTVGMPDVKGMVMPLPPIEEQLAIVDHVLVNRKRISALIARLRGHMQLLAEYRSALISAAVTGQIDVREEVTLDD